MSNAGPQELTLRAMDALAGYESGSDSDEASAGAHARMLLCKKPPCLCACVAGRASRSEALP